MRTLTIDELDVVGGGYQAVTARSRIVVDTVAYGGVVKTTTRSVCPYCDCYADSVTCPGN